LRFKLPRVVSVMCFRKNMTGIESLLLKVCLPVIKVTGIAWYLRIRNRKKFQKLLLSLGRNYSGQPKRSEELYSELIVLFRYPQIQKKINITIFKQYFYELDKIKNLHQKCESLFSTDQNRVILALFMIIETLKNKTDQINLDSESFESQKKIARQLVIDWCYIVFMLTKIGKNGSDYIPINLDPHNLNKVIQQSYGINLDENSLFEKGLSKYGINIAN